MMQSGRAWCCSGIYGSMSDNVMCGSDQSSCSAMLGRIAKSEGKAR